MLAFGLATLGALAFGAFEIARAGLDRELAAWWRDLRLVVVLREVPAVPGEVLGGIQALPGIGELRYVAPAEALAELGRYLGPSGPVLARLPGNPMPARIEIVPAMSLSAGDLRDLVASLERLAAVDSVEAALGWVAPAERLTRYLRIGQGVAGALGALGAGLATAAAAAASRRARRDETMVLRLAGVPEGRLLVPVLAQGLVLSGLGALAGVGALSVPSEVGIPGLAAWLGPLAELAPWPGLPATKSAVLVGSGALIGLLGSLAAGRR